MKKQDLYHLLTIFSVVLLIGLIASCGGNEPQFKVIESREYTAGNKDAVVAILRDKHFSGKTYLSNAPTIMEPYWNDVNPLIASAMGKMSSTAAGLVLVIKVDTYKMLIFVYYENNGSKNGGYWLYNY